MRDMKFGNIFLVFGGAMHHFTNRRGKRRPGPTDRRQVKILLETVKVVYTNRIWK